MLWKMKKMRISSNNTGTEMIASMPLTQVPGSSALLTICTSQKRFAELSTLQQTSIHNQVYPLQKVDYAREVTEASNKCFVLVHLSSSGANVESQRLTELWRQLAAKFGDIKFCEIRGNMCIEGYPERNTPTILVYRNGEIMKQLITLREMKGPRTTVEGKDCSSYLLLCF